MARIVAVAINTFREAVRDRVLHGVLGVALALLLFSLALAEVSLNQQRRVVLDVGLASISLFSVLIAVFLGSSLLYKEIERKTLYVILPKPIERHEFLLGKYLGIVLTAGVFVLIMGAVQLWVTAIQAQASAGPVVVVAVALPGLLAAWMWRAHDRSLVLIPWCAIAFAACAWTAAGAGVGLGPIAAALCLNLAEVSVLTAVALLFSAFSTPFLTALLTFGVWLVGRSADRMVSIKSDVLPAQIKLALRWLAEVVPNFSLFVPGRHTLESHWESGAGPAVYVATSLGYALLYAAIVLLLATAIFARRDLL
ncbi:MAG: ABC transporter permease subunit [Proteobacteria bacterium]|nr:ABC transporter permease subunit [Pseudomonadota bacterium]